MLNRKGTLGLDSVKLFLMGIMFIAVVVFVLIVVGVSMRDTAETVEAKITGAVTNETGINATGNGDYLAYSTEIPGGSFTISACGNASHSTSLVPAGNYTLDSATGYINATNAYIGKGEIWNCTYTYSKTRAEARGMLQNITAGSTSFFTNVSTWFSLLSVVIIILIIALVILAINRFGGGGQTPEGL